MKKVEEMTVTIFLEKDVSQGEAREIRKLITKIKGVHAVAAGTNLTPEDLCSCKKVGK